MIEGDTLGCFTLEYLQEIRKVQIQAERSDSLLILERSDHFVCKMKSESQGRQIERLKQVVQNDQKIKQTLQEDLSATEGQLKTERRKKRLFQISTTIAAPVIGVIVMSRILNSSP